MPLCNCEMCREIRRRGGLPPTYAEFLLDAYDCLFLPRGEIVKPVEGWSDGDDGLAYARINLAVALKKRGPAFVCRAIFEEWPPERLVREIY